MFFKAFKVHNDIPIQKQSNKNSRNIIETLKEVPSMLGRKMEIRIIFSTLQSLLLLQGERRVALFAPDSPS